MKLFSKKQTNNFEDLFDIETIDSTDDNNNSLSDIDASSKGHTLNPIALTSEEVVSKPVLVDNARGSTSALESLKKRMSENSVVKRAETASDADGTASKQNFTAEPKEKKYDISADLLEYIAKSFQEKSEPEKPNINYNTIIQSENEPEKTEKTVKSDKKDKIIKEMPAAPQSLLEKCKPFMLDDNGNDASLQESQTYKLDSIAEILNSQSKNTVDKLSEKYNVTFDDLGRKHTPEALQSTATPPSKKESVDDIVSKIVLSINSAENTQADSPRIISDIDSLPDSVPSETVDSESDNNATIKFTPVAEDDGSSRISVSSQTQPINLSDELIGFSDNDISKIKDEVQLEKNEFEDYSCENEFTSQSNAKKFIRMFAISKRNSFLKTAFSLILGLALSFLKLPFMNGIILANTKTLMIISASVTGIIILLNIDMFKSFTVLFKKHSSPDINAAFASIATLGYCVFGIFSNEITLDSAILLAFILFIRALTCFFKDSYMLSNFKQITGPSPKKAVRLISDSAITFAMAKNATDGDALIAAPQETLHIDDFMKYSTFGDFLGGKLPTINILSVILSIITALACASYFDNIAYGFYSFAAIQCFASMPILFLIDNLPLYSSAKRLNKTGAMIAGKTGAEHIEMTNAVVLNSTDIFPPSSVTLHNMKILSSNSIDDTIIRAASLTESIGNPLAPIFKKIARTGNVTSLPNSDTVKYEDKLGISGWVNDKLLFIGNRTLMEAHGITVPSIEVDRKILRKGFFPVYVASDNVACALLIVQYSVVPEIAHELQKTASLGMTLLINNNDPNLSEKMICDYMGLYDDSVKIMSNAGCHMYKNVITRTSSISAPAAFKGKPITIASIINCASRIKKSNLILSVLYIISAIIGTVLFNYSSFIGTGALISCSTVLLYTIICTALSYLLYLIEKP